MILNHLTKTYECIEAKEAGEKFGFSPEELQWFVENNSSLELSWDGNFLHIQADSGKTERLPINKEQMQSITNII